MLFIDPAQISSGTGQLRQMNYYMILNVCLHYSIKIVIPHQKKEINKHQ